MIPQRSTPSKDSVGEHPQYQVEQIQTTGAAAAFIGSGTRTNRWWTFLVWLMLPFLIAMTMQACGWISLQGATAMAVEDTRARIQADYSPWQSMSFLPIDPAILIEISEETGRTIAIFDGYSTSQPVDEDPTPTPAGATTGEPTSALTPSVTPTAGSASPTATSETTVPATATSTPPSLATDTPPPPATPTSQGNQYFNYTSTPQPPDPTEDDGQGSGTNESSTTNQN